MTLPPRRPGHDRRPAPREEQSGLGARLAQPEQETKR